MSYQSDPSLGGSTTVSDSPALSGVDAVDYFIKNTHAFDSTYTRNVGIILLNEGGTAFLDTSLPTRLEAALFQELSLGSSIHRRSDLDSFYFDARITSFELLPADVPEPGIGLLLAAGAGSLLAARRRARRAKIC